MTKTKSIFGFLAALCLVIPAVFLLAACGETHKASEEWSFNDTQHWHNCVIEGCDEQFDVAAHAFGEWEVVTAAGCETAGLEQRACVCGKTETRAISATGHSYDLNAWTEKTPATCLDSQVLVTKCKNCDAEITKTGEGALGHAWNDGVVTTEPTCINEGVKTFTCTREGCNTTKTEPVAATGVHTYGEWVVDRDATCTTTGVKYRVCTTPGCTASENEIISLKPHNYVDHICDVCGAYDEDVVATITAGEDTTAYTDLASAFAAATNGQTIVLEKDTAIAALIEINTPVTLDLGGNTLSASGNNGLLDVYSELTVKNGTVQSDHRWAVFVEGGAVFTLNADATLISNALFEDFPEGASFSTLTVIGGTAHIYGTITCVNSFAVAGNGNAGNNANIYVYEGATISTQHEIALYMPSAGTLTISGGTISGQVAVYIKSGTAAISGGVFNASGTHADYSYNGNGTDPTGDAIVIDACGYPGGNPKVTITGGEFNVADEAAHGIAYYMYNGNGATEDVTVAESLADSYYSQVVPAATE